MYEDEIDEQTNVPVVDEAGFDRSLRRLAELDTRADELEESLKRVKSEREALSYSLSQFMLASGCSRKTLDGITFTQKQKVYAKVEDKAQLQEWIEANNAELLVMAVHAAKLNAYCNEQLEQGGDIPAGVNPSFIKYSVSIKR